MSNTLWRMRATFSDQKMFTNILISCTESNNIVIIVEFKFSFFWLYFDLTKMIFFFYSVNAMVASANIEKMPYRKKVYKVDLNFTCYLKFFFWNVFESKASTNILAFFARTAWNFDVRGISNHFYEWLTKKFRFWFLTVHFIWNIFWLLSWAQIEGTIWSMRIVVAPKKLRNMI